jgi:hypothetical protein
MRRSMPPQTKTVRELRATTLNALVALHHSDPKAVHELAAELERVAMVHTAFAPNVPCSECDVKRSVARLLHAVATLREMLNAGEITPGELES